MTSPLTWGKLPSVAPLQVAKGFQVQTWTVMRIQPCDQLFSGASSHPAHDCWLVTALPRGIQHTWPTGLVVVARLQGCHQQQESHGAVL